MSISGDKSVGHDDEGSKTMFDFMGSSTDVEDGINAEDRKKLWDNVWKILSKEFDEKTLDIWCSYWGAYDHKKLQNKGNKRGRNGLHAYSVGLLFPHLFPKIFSWPVY